MNVLGIGIDATDIPRVAAIVSRYGDRFLQRVFTKGELAYCTKRRDPSPHLAGRFAAKEATFKALGTGWSRDVNWQDVEVFRGAGPPELRLHRGAADRAQVLGASRLLLTITHSELLAIAQVVLVGK
jgi:holo-[acyl-carrier protein] synthase